LNGAKEERRFGRHRKASRLVVRGSMLAAAARGE